MEHPSNARQSLDKFSEMNHVDADGKECTIMPAVGTMDTIPSLSDLPCGLSNILATDYPSRNLKDDPSPDVMGDGDEIEEYEHFLVPECDKDPSLLSMSGHEIDEHGHFVAPECSSDEGRLCDINYSDCFDELVSDPSRSGLDDPLLSLMDSEPLVPKKCSSMGGLNRKTVHNEVAKVQKRVWKFGTSRNGDEEEVTVLFCNRLLKMVKAKQDEEEDPKVKLLAKESIMAQIAQHADQAQDIFKPSLKGFGQQFSAGPSVGCKFSASVGDLSFDHGSGLQVITPLSSHSKSPTSAHRPVDPSVLDEAVEIDEFAESTGEA